MIKNLVVVLFVLMVHIVQGQNDVKIEFISETHVVLNDLKIDKNTTFEEMKDLLGEPVIYKEYATGKTNYHYADNGITLQTMDDKLLFIGFNYNWDGDKTFPESTYTGELIIEGVAFNKDSEEAILDEIENTEFMQIMPGFIISKPKTDKKNTFIAVGFEEGKLTQIGFEFH